MILSGGTLVFSGLYSQSQWQQDSGSKYTPLLEIFPWNITPLETRTRNGAYVIEAATAFAANTRA